jgi:hypothetical protein
MKSFEVEELYIEEQRYRCTGVVQGYRSSRREQEFRCTEVVQELVGT